MSLTEKQEDGNKHLQRVISWLSKYASEGDRSFLITNWQSNCGLLQIAPRERTVKKYLKHGYSIRRMTMWILQVEVADLVMSLIVLKVSTQTTSMTLIIRERKQAKRDNYDSRKRRWNESRAFDAQHMNGAKRQGDEIYA